MRIPAREQLTVFYAGEEAPGLAFYSLCEADTVQFDFPSEKIPYFSAAEDFVLHGPGWRVFMWEVVVEGWAEGSALASALVAVLNHLNERGGRVSWIGRANLFCDPPELFSPSCMSTGVLLAADNSGRVYGHLDPDRPMQPLDDATMLELRHVAAGLADLE